MRNAKTLTIIGPRAHHLPWGFNQNDPLCCEFKARLKDRLIDLIETDNVNRFMLGLSMGFEQTCADVVIDLKSDYPDLFLEAVIAEHHWLLLPHKYREWLTGTLKRCDKIHAFEESLDETNDRFVEQYLKEQSDIVLLAVTNEHTASMVEHTVISDKQIICLKIPLPSSRVGK